MCTRSFAGQVRAERIAEAQLEYEHGDQAEDFAFACCLALQEIQMVGSSYPFRMPNA
jgi:hypothetical protein